MDNIRDRYTFVTDNKTAWTCIGIRGGKFDGVVYKYGKVTLPKEKVENGNFIKQEEKHQKNKNTTKNKTV